MAFSTFFFYTDHTNISFEEDIKPLAGVSFIVTLITLNKTFKLSKELFN